MLSAEAPGRATDRADGHRQLALPSGHEPEFRELLDDGITSRWQKIAEHDLDDWPQARHGHADRHSDERVLADRRVLHAAWKPFGQSGIRLEDAAVVRDILAKEIDTRVSSHLVGQRRVDGFA